MLSKEESKQLRIEFWNKFNLIMRPIRSSNGRKMNWLNYPSDAKDLYIRLDCDKNGARLNFDIQAKNAGVREIIWEQLHELKVVLEESMGTNGKWIENMSSESVPCFHRISWEKSDVNLYNSSDHQAIHSFLKDRITQFDSFYQEYKDILVNLIS